VSKRILAALFILLTLVLAGGGASVLKAREIYTAKWYGFITDTADLNKGRNVTADQIKKSVAGGAKYALVNGIFFARYIELGPADKAAPFAGQQVYISGSITTDSLTKGGNAVDNAISAGGVYKIDISSITPHENDGIY